MPVIRSSPSNNVSPTGSSNLTTIGLPSEDSVAQPAVSHDTDQMKTSARAFYQHLYNAEAVCDNAIKEYLDDIQFTKTLDPIDSVKLMNPLTIDDLTEQASRLTEQSSPGAYGLSYPYFAVLLQIPMLERLVEDLYNQALDGILKIVYKIIPL